MQKTNNWFFVLHIEVFKSFLISWLVPWIKLKAMFVSGYDALSWRGKLIYTTWRVSFHCSLSNLKFFALHKLHCAWFLLLNRQRWRSGFGKFSSESQWQTFFFFFNQFLTLHSWWVLNVQVSQDVRNNGEEQWLWVAISHWSALFSGLFRMMLFFYPQSRSKNLNLFLVYWLIGVLE